MRSRPRPTRWLLLLALVLVAGSPPLAGAEEIDVQAELSRARRLELVEEEYGQARRRYETVLAVPDLDAAARGAALEGAARCLNAERRIDDAAAYWKRILADTGLSERSHEYARTQLAAYDRSKADQESKTSRDAELKRVTEAFKNERRKQAQELVARARTALSEHKYEVARALCWEAIAKDDESPDAHELLDEIERKLPNRGELIGNLLEFFQTAQFEEYQRLRTDVRELAEAGKTRYGHKDFKQADQMFRDAIRRIDASGFLASTDIVESNSLADDRADLIEWLRLTQRDGTAQGMSFEPEPPVPDLTRRASSLEERIYAILADAFSGSSDAEEPLRFYEMVSAAPRTRRAPQMQSSPFQGGLDVARAEGGLTRARWAERWIRATIPGDWQSSGRPVGRPGRSGRPPRILTRFGQVLCVQNRAAIHQRIEALRDAFAERPEPVVIDVHVLAATGPGIVEGCEALRAQAGPPESGRDVIVRNKLAGECLRELVSLKQHPMRHLGSVQLGMGNESTVTLTVTELTSDHPQMQALAPPPLAILPETARYGLWLELYAEDMPGIAPGFPRSAVSAVARVRRPDGSVVVPKSGAGGLPQTRLARMVEQSIEADRELPHFGALLVLGLSNPFPQTRDEYGELVLLMAVRPHDVESPDPPPTEVGPGTVPEDASRREHRVGPLASEVVDQWVYEGWPRRRPATEPIAPAVARDRHNEHLARLLARAAELITPDQPAAELQLTIKDQNASALLSPEEHKRLESAVTKLRQHENDLYQVRVLSAIVAAERIPEWTEVSGITKRPRGTFLVDGTAWEATNARMRSAESSERLYEMRRRLTARATQQIKFQKLNVETIVRDQRVRPVDDTRSRYTSVPGVVEEGLIVEVRPGLDKDGLREVTVRARAAKLKEIEDKTYPNARVPEALIQLPEWFPLSDADDGWYLANGEALLLPLDLPGSPGRKILVMVTVNKVQ